MTPVAQMPLTVGQQLRLAGDPNPWTVRAVSENFAALARPVTSFDHPGNDYWGNYPELNHEPLGDILYTVLDWRNGVRGPCNLVGQAYGDGDYLPSECEQMLAEFESGDLEVSHRNQVRIEFGEVAR